MQFSFQRAHIAPAHHGHHHLARHPARPHISPPPQPVSDHHLTNNIQAHAYPAASSPPPALPHPAQNHAMPAPLPGATGSYSHHTPLGLLTSGLSPAAVDTSASPFAFFHGVSHHKMHASPSDISVATYHAHPSPSDRFHLSSPSELSVSPPEVHAGNKKPLSPSDLSASPSEGCVTMTKSLSPSDFSMSNDAQVLTRGLFALVPMHVPCS
jgi:hypothetical protein